MAWIPGPMCMLAQLFSSLVLFAPPRGTGDGDLPLCPILTRLTCCCPHPLTAHFQQFVPFLSPTMSLSWFLSCISLYISILSPSLCMSLTPISVSNPVCLSVSPPCLLLLPFLSSSVSVCLSPAQSLCVSLALHGSPPHFCVSVPLP